MNMLEAERRMSLQELTTILTVDVVSTNRCVEMNFGINEHPKYDNCWLGKMKDDQTGTGCYWFGLVKGGSEAYDFPTLTELLEAKVFDGKSLKDVLSLIEWYSLDGSEIPQSFIDEY